MLIAEGHRRIAYLDIDVSAPPPVCARSFVETIRKRLGQDGRKWLFRPARISYENARRVTEEALRRLKGVTALMLTDNFYGEAVLNVLRERGIRPGRDIRVIGFGDTILADRWSPRLSHFGLCIEEQVAWGLDVLLEEVRAPNDLRPQNKLFESQYIPRDT